MEELRWSLTDHGPNELQFYPGTGDHVVMGVGDTYFDALDDAIEQIREQAGATPEVEKMIEEVEAKHRPASPEPWMTRSVHEVCRCEFQRAGGPVAFDEAHEDCELGHFVSIRWGRRC